jgi:hypothetical protein
MLFARRLARDNVQRFALDSRLSSGRKSFLRLQMSRRVALIAASLILAVGVGLWAQERPRSPSHDSGVAMSLETMSVELDGTSRADRCFTPGVGIACGEVQLASR